MTSSRYIRAAFSHSPDSAFSCAYTQHFWMRFPHYHHYSIHTAELSVAAILRKLGPSSPLVPPRYHRSSELRTVHRVAIRNTVLAQRLPTRYIGANRLSSFMQEQNVGHLCRIANVYSTADAYETGTSSEPAISLAVASAMRIKQQGKDPSASQKWSQAVVAVASARTAFGLMLGEEGEVSIRILLCMAMDLVAASAVQIKRNPLPTTANNAAASLVLLSDWLCTLLGFGPNQPIGLQREEKSSTNEPKVPM